MNERRRGSDFFEPIRTHQRLKRLRTKLP